MATTAISTGGISVGQSVGFFGKAYTTLEILFTDIFPSNVCYVLPNAFSWAYRTLWTGSVRSCEALDTVGKVADLFVHGVIPSRVECPAVLLVHGEHSHALTMLHLADVAEAEGRAVFSVNLPYDDGNPEGYRSLLRQSINRVDQVISKGGGRLSDLILVGHSRGAIESAHIACVEGHSKVKKVISFAGRFKVIEPSDRPCRDSLKPIVNAVWEKVKPSQVLRVPFYQIAARRDWCIDPDASIVRTDCGHCYVEAGHLGVLYHPDAVEQFKMWIAV